MSASRPVVDFSKLSLGSLKRYEALYGVRVPEGQDLRDCVKDHFGMMVYNVMNKNFTEIPRYGEDSSLTCDLNTFKTEIKSPDEVIESFLRIKPDDKDEATTRKSTRYRDRLDRGP